MNLTLRSIKEKSLAFYQNELANLKEGENDNATSYLNAAIEVLKIDLNGTKLPEEELIKTPTTEVLKQLKSLGLSPNKSLLFGFLLVNKKIKPVQFFKSTGLPRTEVYHIINELRLMGLLHVIPSHPKVIVLAMPENPLQPLIDSKSQELSEMKSKAKQFEFLVKTK